MTERLLGLKDILGRALLLTGFASGFAGCGPATPSADATDFAHESLERPGLAFEDVFRLERLVALEEPDTALITGIDWLAVSDDGRLAIPDPMESQVRVYGPEGRLVANLGRHGEGPGEFQRARFTAFAEDGSLYVADGLVPRITRFTPSLELDTVFALPEAQKVHGLVAVPGGFAAGHIRAISAGAGFANTRDSGFVSIYDNNGRRTASLYRVPDAIFDVPYWLSATLNMGTAGYILAAHDDRIIVGTSLLFPLDEFNVRGEQIRSLAHPPASWIEASRPERGAFAPPNQMAKFQPWMRTFTTIHRAAILDDGSVLLVHRSLDPAVLAYEEASYRADLYDGDGTKMWEDVALPGDLLTVVAGQAYVVSGGAPEAWTITVYSVSG